MMHAAKFAKIVPLGYTRCSHQVEPDEEIMWFGPDVQTLTLFGSPEGLLRAILSNFRLLYSNRTRL
jgi:hypothetical protein